MLFMSIEESLGLTKEEIERRKEEISGNIPTFPGTEFLKVKLKRFEVQPWPFLIYSLHYDSNKFQELISCYQDYDGAENASVIIEDLKEYYLLHRVLEETKYIQI